MSVPPSSNHHISEDLSCLSYTHWSQIPKTVKVLGFGVSAYAFWSSSPGYAFLALGVWEIVEIIIIGRIAPLGTLEDMVDDVEGATDQLDRNVTKIAATSQQLRHTARGISAIIMTSNQSLSERGIELKEVTDRADQVVIDLGNVVDRIEGAASRVEASSPKPEKKFCGLF